jgi:hypothetical protein
MLPRVLKNARRDCETASGEAACPKRRTSRGCGIAESAWPPLDISDRNQQNVV